MLQSAIVTSLMEAKLLKRILKELGPYFQHLGEICQCCRDADFFLKIMMAMIIEYFQFGPLFLAAQ